MSNKHPIIAVTGASGSGTKAIHDAFLHLFQREKVKAVCVDGESFRRYDRDQMRQVFQETSAKGEPINHFGPRANLFDRLEGLFREYSRSGGGLVRNYVRSEQMAERTGVPIGSFTPWEEVPPGTDLLFYRGLHGGCIETTWSHRKMTPSHNPIVVRNRERLEKAQDTGVDVAQWVDLLIGAVPVINLEWIQKIHHDCNVKGCSREAVVQTILRYMPDYVRYIAPQFSLSDFNIQRIPLVDTSNPFLTRDSITDSESMLVIRFRDSKSMDFPYLLKMLENSFMSRRNTIVIPGGSLQVALEVVCAPLVHDLIERSRKPGAV